MSGIINMVTKDGGQKFSGSLNGYGGGYQTSDPLFRGLDQLDMNNEKNLQFSLGGPVPLLSKFLTFYFTGRQYKINGHLNGLRTYSMYGDTLENSKIVPMSWHEKTTTNSKLTFHLSSKIKLRLGMLTSDESYRDYDHNLQLAPDGRPFNFSQGRDYKLNLTHTLSSKNFYSLSFSQFEHEYKRYRFKSPTDESYVDPYYYSHLQAIIPIYSFGLWGVDLGRFERKSVTRLAKLDFTSQLNTVHQVKFGGEIRRHKLTLDTYALRDSSENDEVFTIEIPNPDTFNRSQYNVQPMEYSIYIQDKIEYKSVILNVGIRWDLFDANGEIPTNPVEPYIGNPRNPAVDSLLTLSDSLYGDNRLLENIDWSEYADHYAHLLSDSGASLIDASGWWTKTSPKQQISPRFGIAYPITDQGVIHFSFGHFFQIPTFNRLYDNPGYKIAETSGSFGIYPNANLKPQRTVMYELGLRQTFLEDYTIDVTGFYRDVRDWVSTGIPVDLGGGASYYTFVNKDYSNVRGVTINLDKRYSQLWALNLNYTFQIAEGSNSNPSDEFGAVLANREPPRSIIPLDWDQKHTVNGNIYVGSGPWGVTLIGRYGSGYPYTPQIVVSSTQGATISTQLVNNSRRKPATYTIDLKSTYTVSLRNISIQFFTSIYNLLDRRNENIVWGDTGRANKTLTEPTGDELEAYVGDDRPNTIAEYFTHPEWYHPPRQIQAGLTISF
ncbi:MAG: TonB-dependent receptor plug domain-containing protein [Fidelibacterota bacterium]